MAYLQNEDKIENYDDLSIIDDIQEKKDKISIASDILIDSFFNQICLFENAILEFINLILIGHSINDNTNFNYFNYFQIGFCYLHLFGLIFSLGIIKSLNFHSHKHERYICLKKVIYLLILLIIIPSSFLFKFSMKLLYENNTNLNEVEMNINNIYNNFIFYSPFYLLFYFLFQLNLKFYQKTEINSSALGFLVLFNILHILLSYVLIYQYNLFIKGISISLTISSFICYICSNYLIKDECFINKTTFNFYFIPSDNFFDEYFQKNIYKIIIRGFYCFIDYFPIGIFILFSFYLGQLQLTINIMFFNIFLISHNFCRGLSSTLKNYIQYYSIKYKHSHYSKMNFIKTYVLLVICVLTFISLLLFTLKEKIGNIYISEIDENKMFENTFVYLLKYFIWMIAIEYIIHSLEGYIKGINSENNIIKYKIIFPLIFIPIGFTFCFLFNFQIIGMWFGILLMNIFYLIPHSINMYKCYGRFLSN